MESTELRIGNLVQYGANVNTVMTLDNCVRVSGCDDWIFADNKALKGIPLTEDWLLKLGFVDGEINTANYNLYSFNNHSNTIVIIERDGTELGRCGIVHELQNWFYVITSTELTLKDK